MNIVKFGNTSPYFFRSNCLIILSMFPSNYTKPPLFIFSYLICLNYSRTLYIDVKQLSSHQNYFKKPTLEIT